MANNTIKRVWNANKLVSIEDLSGMTFQGENEGHTFEVSGVDDSGSAVSISGTVTAVFLRADNAAISISGSVSSGKAVATLTQNCYTVPGRFLFTIFVTANDQKTAIYSATGNVARTEGTATGSVPPLVTDSIQTGSITASGDVTVGGVLDVTPRRCYATLSSPGWYRVLTVSWVGNGNRSFAIDINITRTFNDSNNEVHYVKMLKTFNAIPSFENEASKTNSLVVDKIRYTIDSNNNGHLDIHYNASVNNDTAVDFTVHTDYRYQYLFTAANMTYMGTADPANETVLKVYTFAAIATGIRVVHAASSISFGDAIATIKDIIGDNEIAWAGYVADAINANISNFNNGVHTIFPGSGSYFFATLGKYNEAYYAAELFTYSYPWRMMIRNSNGTYYADIYY